ncbi:unnamed protein product [Fraxinus pennsylvanica]|uniref:Uncharacterized protein n=1 Tax=Fraxinus pennsylvanica TaxID=56036 RepID=A0AAD2E5K3_9LAMI|nr:unnamed protein product [Fraxinus pennsylvanica]
MVVQEEHVKQIGRVGIEVEDYTDNFFHQNCFESETTVMKKIKKRSHVSCQVTVYDYFVNSCNIDLPYPADFHCINIGKPKCPTYFPIEPINKKTASSETIDMEFFNLIRYASHSKIICYAKNSVQLKKNTVCDVSITLQMDDLIRTLHLKH